MRVESVGPVPWPAGRRWAHAVASRGPGFGLAVALLCLSPCGCDKDPAQGEASDAAGCEVLFGIPGEKTGLTAEQCRPACSCAGFSWKAPSYADSFVQSLVQGWHLTTPFAELASDPYEGPAPAQDAAGTVCAVVPGEAVDGGIRGYALVTFGSEQEARVAGAKPTHAGKCGVCSTLANLAVYMRYNDLADPVRQCGLQGISDGKEANLACLQALGFDLPCAQIWYFNTVHTSKQCMQTCVAELKNPYHLPDGALNPCIQCDEEQSGAVFKDVAGRTRRNSGLPNALCRPCSEVQPFEHVY